MRTSSSWEKIQEITKCLILSNDDLREVANRLLKEINRGLSKETHNDASVKMFPTYVRELPNGNETGQFLALDLGGTNFRVLLIDLEGGGKEHIQSHIYAIPQKIMLGTGEELFDHIAECLASFMKEYGVVHKRLPLGFTFSFPCVQEGLTVARLVQWTKGFNCSGVVGEDVVQLLHKAVKKRGDIEIDVVALVNDTTGTLMSCAYKNRNCRIGFIVGTGSNACYMETLDKVETWDGDNGEPRQVIVNTEWGAFGDNGVLDFMRTKWDFEIDKKSLNPGRQIYEKMISGMYMGEIVRLVLEDLRKQNLLFNGKGSDLLTEPGRFYTKYVSEVEGDEKDDYSSTYMVLEELGLVNVTEEDCQVVRYVSQLVSSRAAHLSSVGVAVVLNRLKKPFVTVAMDGSVYRFHPHFHDLMVEKARELTEPGYEFDLMLSEDGSGRGAALVAAVAVRIQKKKEKLNAAKGIQNNHS